MGPWVIDEAEAAAMPLACPVEWTGQGVYTRLSNAAHVHVMSDIDSELVEHLRLIDIAHGRVLITGLGLGLMPAALLATGRVEHIDIVEIASEVIDLVLPSIADPCITVHHADAYEWDAVGRVWDFAWHDLMYSDIMPGPSFELLKARYKARQHLQWQQARYCDA